MILADAACNWSFCSCIRSFWSINVCFYNQVTIFEAGISVLDPTVSGKEVKCPFPASSTGYKILVTWVETTILQCCTKIQLMIFSFGLIYDQPFGADAEYQDSTLFTNASGNIKAQKLTHKTFMLFGN